MESIMLKKATLCLALCISFVYSAVNYPYPQRKSYGNSSVSVKNSSADADLKARFQTYMTNFYEEGNCGGNSCARIKFDTPAQTVSEGIGYGMLMMVYFSDNSKSYQSEFDKLLAYYKNFRNNNGVMHWKINGFSNVVEQNGATDAEYDVALALIMAHYQFGDAKYETEAKDLIGKIWQHEHNSNGLHKPGDAWDSDKNPSYVAPAAYELFKEWGNSGNWTSALSANYTFLKNNQNSSTGLPSNWANADGSVKECTACGYSSQNYGQDAVRAPWRWATANAWFGHADAKTLLNKLATWVNGKNAGDIKGPISLTGTMGSDANSGYLGSLMNALMVSSTYQSKLNSFWSTLMTNSNESYYNQSMLVLTGLLASGNMPNLKACASNSCGTTMPQLGGDGEGISLDKFSVANSESQEDRRYAATWESWYAYTDEKAGYNDAGEPANGQALSTISNSKFTAKDEQNNCEEIQSYEVVQKEGDDWIVKINSYRLDQGDYKYDPFVAIGLNARNNGKSASQGGYSLASCEGFSYEYKGEAHKFKVLTTLIVEGTGEDHYKVISNPSTSSWTAVTVPNDELAQPTWVAAAKRVEFDASKIYSFAWELVGDVKAANGNVTTGISAMSGSLAIKDFRCVGGGDLGLPEEKPVSACSPPTSIVSPKLASGANSLIAMQNAIKLQAAGSAKVQIFDLKGNMVRALNLAQGSHVVQIADLPKGLYIVKASSDSWKRAVAVPVK
jgi:endo-1,4-beta-D-glucanase Y